MVNTWGLSSRTALRLCLWTENEETKGTPTATMKKRIAKFFNITVFSSRYIEYQKEIASPVSGNQQSDGICSDIIDDSLEDFRVFHKTAAGPFASLGTVFVRKNRQ